MTMHPKMTLDELAGLIDRREDGSPAAGDAGAIANRPKCAKNENRRKPVASGFGAHPATGLAETPTEGTQRPPQANAGAI